MTKDESTILHEHGERLARIETTLSNHVMTEFKCVKNQIARLDSRLWWILGTVVLALVSVVASLLGVSR